MHYLNVQKGSLGTATADGNEHDSFFIYAPVRQYDIITVVVTTSTARPPAPPTPGGGTVTTVVRDDKTAIQLRFADGSIGTVNYFANGSKSYPKEMLEVFSDGRVLKMENFRRTLGYGFRGFRRLKTARQDMGHRAEIAALVEHLQQGGEPLIPFDQLENITRASLAAVTSAREQRTIAL